MQFAHVCQPVLTKCSRNAAWPVCKFLPHKYISKFVQIHFEICTNTFNNLDKYILEFAQIHFTIWTNTFVSLNKCILQIVTGMQADQYGNFNCPGSNSVAMLELKSIVLESNAMNLNLLGCSCRMYLSVIRDSIRGEV